MTEHPLGLEVHILLARPSKFLCFHGVYASPWGSEVSHACPTSLYVRDHEDVGREGAPPSLRARESKSHNHPWHRHHGRCDDGAHPCGSRQREHEGCGRAGSGGGAQNCGIGSVTHGPAWCCVVTGDWMGMPGCDPLSGGRVAPWKGGGQPASTPPGTPPSVHRRHPAGSHPESRQTFPLRKHTDQQVLATP